MARDKIVAAIVAAFGEHLGGKRALGSTWNRTRQGILRRSARKPRARNGATPTPAALTPAEKGAAAGSAMAHGSDLAQAPDLMDRVVQQVQAMGVVNERELIMLTYIAATSRVLRSSGECFGKGCQQQRQIIHRRQIRWSWSARTS